VEEVILREVIDVRRRPIDRIHQIGMRCGRHDSGQRVYK
jgi:hypothetical protein